MKRVISVLLLVVAAISVQAQDFDLYFANNLSDVQNLRTVTRRNSALQWTKINSNTIGGNQVEVQKVKEMFAKTSMKGLEEQKMFWKMRDNTALCFRINDGMGRDQVYDVQVFYNGCKQPLGLGVTGYFFLNLPYATDSVQVQVAKRGLKNPTAQDTIKFRYFAYGWDDENLYTFRLDSKRQKTGLTYQIEYTLTESGQEPVVTTLDVKGDKFQSFYVPQGKTLSEIYLVSNDQNDVRKLKLDRRKLQYGVWLCHDFDRLKLESNVFMDKHEGRELTVFNMLGTGLMERYDILYLRVFAKNGSKGKERVVKNANIHVERINEKGEYVADETVKVLGYDSQTQSYKIQTMTNPALIEIIADGYYPAIYKYQGAFDPKTKVLNPEKCNVNLRLFPTSNRTDQIAVSGQMLYYMKEREGIVEQRDGKSYKVCAIAPLKTGSAYLTRTIGKARMQTPITVNNGFTAGVSFDDEHAKALCLQSFNSDGNSYLSLSELRQVNDNQLVNAVIANQTEAEQIATFNEFALFKGITQLGTTSFAQGASHKAAAGTAFQHMKNLREFRIPESVTVIADEAFKGCDKLETVTLPSTVMNVSGKAFYGSQVKNILVDYANAVYTSRDGLLFNKENDLVCYPNGRNATSATLKGELRSILPNAIYKVAGLDSILIDSPNLTNVVSLSRDGIVHHSGSQQMQVFVNDGSFDRRLLQQYKDDASWEAFANNDCLKRYYPLEIGDAKAATLYLGFNTQLPEALHVYLVNMDYTNESTVMLLNISQKINNKLGAGTSVIVRANQADTYRLFPYEGNDATKIPLYLNALNGVGEQGLRVNQGDSNEGTCLTLGRNSQNQLGFFYYKNDFIKPFHAYLPVNTINARIAVFDDIDNLDIAGISDEPMQEVEADLFDTLFAYKKSDDGQSCRAVWYYGDDQNINIPAEVEGIPVTALGKNLFYDNDLPVWSVNVPSSIKTLRVARKEKDNPFYGLNDSTIIYLPSAEAGYTMPDDEWNVVMGDQCKRLYLVDTWSFIPPRDFYADHVQYTNQLWANPDIVWNYESSEIEHMNYNHKDGTNEALAREADFDLFDIQYSRKAYAVCLPFDVNLKEMETNEESVLKAYQLKYVKNNRHLVFVEVPQQLKAGEPYFVVVDGGGYIIMRDEKTKISAQTTPLTITDIETGAQVGLFKGTFAFVMNDDVVADHAFVIQETGHWHRIDNQTEAQSRVPVWPFRAYFSRTDGFSSNSYFSNFIVESSNACQRAAANDGITEFPADAYHSDIDFDVEDDETNISPVIHTIDLDGTERIYDLSGRTLRHKPVKGAYIKNGKKYINK